MVITNLINNALIACVITSSRMEEVNLLEEKFFEMLAENLSNESKWFLVILEQESPNHVNKELLREKVNELYSEIKKSEELLINSRYVLDIHTARLEGAGLVKVERIGKVRMYSITDFGLKLIDYLENVQNN